MRINEKLIILLSLQITSSEALCMTVVIGMNYSFPFNKFIIMKINFRELKVYTSLDKTQSAMVDSAKEISDGIYKTS